MGNRAERRRLSGGRAWAARVVGAVALVLGLLAAPLGCSATIVAPGATVDPVRVFVADHGRTASLVLPTEDGGTVRYAYGDWRYYALAETGPVSSVLALLAPTQGTLGRRRMAAAPEAGAVLAAVRVPIDNLYPVEVERAEAARLVRRLDDLFEENIATRVERVSTDFEFVHHPARYSYFRNSNHAVAAWLREMGVAVRGPTYNSRWQVSRPVAAVDGRRATTALPTAQMEAR